MAITTVVNSDDFYAAADPFQRRSFYAVGRFWVFYTTGVGVYFKTSTDGAVWSAATLVRASAIGSHEFATYWDGQYVHYAYARFIDNAPLYYRRGEPQTDGTINWSAVEQTAVAGVIGVRYWPPNVCVDSDGYPWVGYRRKNVVNGHPYCSKSSTNDGTWVTDGGFPYQLKAVDNYWGVALVPLSSAKMYIVYCQDKAVSYGILYDGGFGAEETAMADANAWFPFSVINYGDDVHLVYVHDVTLDIMHCQRTWGVGWEAEVTVQAGTSDIRCCLSINEANGEMYCFWKDDPTANHIYYKKRDTDGPWDVAATDWHDESPNALRADCIECNYHGGYISVLWQLDTGDVRHDYLEVADNGDAVRGWCQK